VACFGDRSYAAWQSITLVLLIQISVTDTSGKQLSLDELELANSSLVVKLKQASVTTAKV